MDRLAVLVCIVAVSLVLGAAAAARYFEPKLQEAARLAGESDHAVKTCQAAGESQNLAIEAMRAESERRHAAAAAGAATAHEKAAVQYRAGLSILGTRTSLGADACADAREAFDVELRAERGKP